MTISLSEQKFKCEQIESQVVALRNELSLEKKLLQDTERRFKDDKENFLLQQQKLQSQLTTAMNNAVAATAAATASVPSMSSSNNDLLIIGELQDKLNKAEMQVNPP